MAGKVNLSVIIVSYNNKELLKQCLESLIVNGLAGSEIIVVDNHSTDNSVRMVNSLINNPLINNQPIIKLIKNKKNLGFARANNQAWRLAQSQYILFLNQDTLVLDNALLKMVVWLEKHPQVGILGCQILDREKKVSSSGGFFPNLSRVFFWMSGLDHFSLIARLIGAYHLPPSFFQEQRDLDWVQGCCLLTRKEVLEATTGFDESFFMYAEEIDLCLRAKKLGWQVWFSPDSKIIHFGSTKGERPILGEYLSLLSFSKKHLPSWQLPLLGFFLRLGAVLRIIFFGIIRKDEKLKKIYLKAYRQAGRRPSSSRH